MRALHSCCSDYDTVCASLLLSWIKQSRNWIHLIWVPQLTNKPLYVIEYEFIDTSMTAYTDTCLPRLGSTSKTCCVNIILMSIRECRPYYRISIVWTVREFALNHCVILVWTTVWTPALRTLCVCLCVQIMKLLQVCQVQYCQQGVNF